MKQTEKQKINEKVEATSTPYDKEIKYNTKLLQKLRTATMNVQATINNLKQLEKEYQEGKGK